MSLKTIRKNITVHKNPCAFVLEGKKLKKTVFSLKTTTNTTRKNTINKKTQSILCSFFSRLFKKKMEKNGEKNGKKWEKMGKNGKKWEKNGKKMEKRKKMEKWKKILGGFFVQERKKPWKIRNNVTDDSCIVFMTLVGKTPIFTRNADPILVRCQRGSAWRRASSGAPSRFPGWNCAASACIPADIYGTYTRHKSKRSAPRATPPRPRQSHQSTADTHVDSNPERCRQPRDSSPVWKWPRPGWKSSSCPETGLGPQWR